MTQSFTSLYNAGFTQLVCVIPPGAPMSPASKIPGDQRGKAPGRPNQAGQWGGYDWIAYEPTPRDCAVWDRARGNVGLQAASYPAVDIDVTDARLAELLTQETLRVLGPAPLRIGRAPKALLIYRTAEPFGRRRLRFKAPDGVEHLIEVLGRGQQYVVAGVHPATSQPYQTSPELTEPAALTEITAEAADALLDALALVLDAVGCEVYRTHSEGLPPEDRAKIDQSGLHAPSLEALAELMAGLPNTEAFFPGRDQYVAVGYGVKAAGGADPERAFEIFHEWASRWEGAVDEDIRVDWDKMKPPFSVGWDFLLAEAARCGQAEVAAAAEFGDVAEPAPLAPAAPEPSQKDKEPAQVMPFSDVALANACARTFGAEVRYAHGQGWISWEGTRWMRDNSGFMEGRISKVAGAMSARALREIDKPDKAERIALRLCSANTIAGVKRLLLRPSLCVEADALDADPMLLNTPAGVIDLNTGAYTEHTPGMLLTRSTGVAPAETSAGAARWREFLREATGGNDDLETYLQRLAGYALTGHTREHMVAFLFGDGGNGKSVFLNVLTAIMGEYAETAPMDVFVASSYDRHPTDLAGLAGARLVTASETQEGRRWDEAKIKLMTGGDRITARFMRQDFFRYTPRFTLLFAGNHAPQLGTVDAAIARRMHMIPFTRKPARPDAELPEKLREEYPAILRWAIEGAGIWAKVGLLVPDTITSATRDYLVSEDALGRFLTERCTEGEAMFVLTQQIYDEWLNWCRDAGEKAGAGWSMKRLSQQMQARGFMPKRDTTTGLRGFAGVTIINDDVRRDRAVNDFAGLAT